MKLDDFLQYKGENDKTPQWLKDEAIEAKGHSCCCPKCGEEPTDNGPFENPYEYEVGGERWPKTYNFYSYSNDMGYGTDWTEYHKCHECKTIYWFVNGS